MDEARQMVFQEIQRYEQQILGLRNQLNTLIPIARASPEILLQIFVVMIEDDVWGSMKCIPLTHVCRQWRSVALNAPGLWTKLSCKNLQWTVNMLDRSKTAPLTVFMDGTTSSEIAVPVLKHLSRIKSLTIDNWSATRLQEMHERLKDNSSSAPQLEVLSLSCSSDLAWALPSSTFQQTDRLHDLVIENIRVDWSHSPFFCKLEKLRIQAILPVSQPTLTELIAALNQMPALKFLFLDGMPPTVPVETSVTVLAHPPNLESIIIRYVPTIHTLTAFLSQVKPPSDLKVFIVVNNYSYSSRQEFRDFYLAIRRSLPGLCSRVKYINIVLQEDKDMYFDAPDTGKILIQCFASCGDEFFKDWFETDLETDPADIGLELPYSTEATRTTTLVDAFDILDLPHITHLRIDKSTGYPEVLASLEGLPGLRVIQVFAQATIHLIQALNDIQTRASGEGALILPELEDIRVCRDYGPAFEPDYELADNTWQGLLTFLKQRQSLQAQIQTLYLQECWHISDEIVEDLRTCVGGLISE